MSAGHEAAKLIEGVGPAESVVTSATSSARSTSTADAGTCACASGVARPSSKPPSVSSSPVLRPVREEAPAGAAELLGVADETATGRVEAAVGEVSPQTRPSVRFAEARVSGDSLSDAGMSDAGYDEMHPALDSSGAPYAPQLGELIELKPLMLVLSRREEVAREAAAREAAAREASGGEAHSSPYECAVLDDDAATLSDWRRRDAHEFVVASCLGNAFWWSGAKALGYVPRPPSLGTLLTPQLSFALPSSPSSPSPAFSPLPCLQRIASARPHALSLALPAPVRARSTSLWRFTR